MSNDYLSDYWSIVDGELTRTFRYLQDGSTFVTTLRWCKRCEVPTMVYSDGSGNHTACGSDVVAIPAPLLCRHVSPPPQPPEVYTKRRACTVTTQLPDEGAVKRVDVHLLHQSEAVSRSDVVNTYTKDGLFCVLRLSGVVEKYPLLHLFRVTEHPTTQPTEERDGHDR